MRVLRSSLLDVYHEDYIRQMVYWKKKPYKRMLALMADGSVRDMSEQTDHLTPEQKKQFIREGKPVPAGWGVDENGNETTDPNKIKSLFPFGQHKGYGLALIDELYAAYIGGSLPMTVTVTSNNVVDNPYKFLKFQTKFGPGQFSAIPVSASGNLLTDFRFSGSEPPYAVMGAALPLTADTALPRPPSPSS